MLVISVEIQVTRQTVVPETIKITLDHSQSTPGASTEAEITLFNRKPNPNPNPNWRMR